MFRQIAITLCALALAGCARQATKSPAVGAMPNIVFILADDMGYGDVHALNPESKIPTPHLDSLAADGMTFTDAHSPSAVCTPTRYALLTGRYTWRTRLTRGVLDGYGEPLIEDGRATVATVLRQQGYHTGIVGKWHLGLGFAKNGEEFDFSQPVSDNPNTHGFDFSYVIPASLDFPPYIYIRDGAITAFPSITQPAQRFPAFLREGPRGPDLVMEECLDHLLSQAVSYIGRQSKADQPFFLYFPLTAPHKPTLPHPRFVRQTELGPYGDFIVQVDWTVGEVLRALEANGVADNTLVIFTSDNGSYMFRTGGAKDHVSDPSAQAYLPEHHRANYIFRGTKADIWEGGHRVPFLARWPGRIQPGSRCRETVCLVDFLATAAEITGATLADDVAEDSFSLLPLMEGKTWTTPRAPVVHHSSAGMFAIRDGKWKLVAGNGSGGREKPAGAPFEQPYTLFDMAADISEQNDLYGQNPDVAQRLEAALTTIRESGRSR